MIIKKTPHQIEEMAEAGRLSAKVLREVGARVKPGVSTAELDRIAEMIIRMEGGIPAFKGYGGFPGSICASVNDQIVHGIPSNSVILQEGDILSIDTGAIVKGWVGDNAWTYPVGKISPEKKRLLEVTEQCMWAGIEAARPGNHLGDIGHAVQRLPSALATVLCVSMWVMAWVAICTKTPMFPTTVESTLVLSLSRAWLSPLSL